MNEHADRYYRNSGAVPFGGTMLMLFFGVLGAALGALAYALVAFYNPWPFFLFIATLIYMGVVGSMVTWGVKLGKVRHHGFAAIVGLTIGLLTYYLKWMFWFWAADDYQSFIFDAGELWKQIQFLSALPTWSLFGWVPLDGWKFMFWGIEAFIVIGGITAISVSHDVPFCEYCNGWTKPVETADPVQFVPVEVDVLTRELEAENYDVLSEWFRRKPDSSNCYQMVMYRCPKCDDSNYLKVQHFTITIDSEGDESTNETDLMPCIGIPVELIPEIITLNERKFESIETSLGDRADLDSPDWL